MRVRRATAPDSDNPSANKAASQARVRRLTVSALLQRFRLVPQTFENPHKFGLHHGVYDHEEAMTVAKPVERATDQHS